MHALLTGAGFSKWAANLPLASELFDLAVQPFGGRESTRLGRVRECKARWDRAYPGGASELFVAYCKEEGGQVWRDVTWYIVRRLAEPYIWEEDHAYRRRRHVLSVDEHRARSRPGVSATDDFLRRVRSLDFAGAITTNYDMLVEYALGSHQFHYGQVGETLSGRGPYPVATWQRPTKLAGHIGYAKLHGSMSWRVDGRYTDGRGALTGDALIVPPIQGKLASDLLPEPWRLAERILTTSSDVIVFGFAFNSYDHEVLDLLGRAGAGVRRVMLIDPVPPESQVAAIWPKARIDTLPPSSALDISRWLVSEVN